MKAILLFLSKLLLLSLLALPTIDCFQSAYQAILQWGVTDAGSIPFMGARVIYLFFVLVLATPKLSFRRKVLGVAGGLLLYLLIDRLMIPLWKVLPYTQKNGPVPAKEFYTNVYYLFMHWMLPFLLWILLAFRQIEGMCKGSCTQGEDCTPSMQGADNSSGRPSKL